MFNIIKQTKKAVKKVSEKKEFNINLAVFKVIGMSFLVIASLMQVQAAFKDNVLESLEASYRGSIIQESKLMEEAKKFNELLATQHEVKCNIYKSLKAYKDSKGYEIKDPNNNPCNGF